MAGARGVIGANPGSHRVRTYTRRTRNGLVTVREHTASTSLQTGQKSVRSPGLKVHMAKKASARAALIREVRLRALAKRY